MWNNNSSNLSEFGRGNGRQPPSLSASASSSRSVFLPRPAPVDFDPAMFFNACHAMCEPPPAPSLIYRREYEDTPLNLVTHRRTNAHSLGNRNHKVEIVELTDSDDENDQNTASGDGNRSADAPAGSGSSDGGELLHDLLEIEGGHQDQGQGQDREPDGVVNELRRDIFEMKQSQEDSIQRFIDAGLTFQEQITKSIADLVSTVERRLPDLGDGAEVIQTNFPQFQEGSTSELRAVKEPLQVPGSVVTIEEVHGTEPEPEQGPSSMVVSVWQPSTSTSESSESCGPDTDFIAIATGSSGPLNVLPANNEREEAEKEKRLMLAQSVPRNKRQPFFPRIRSETPATSGGLPPTPRPKRQKSVSPMTTTTGDTNESGNGQNMRSSATVTTTEENENEDGRDQLAGTVAVDPRIKTCQYCKKSMLSKNMPRHVLRSCKRTEQAGRRSSDIMGSHQSHICSPPSRRPRGRGLRSCPGRRPGGQ